MQDVVDFSSSRTSGQSGVAVGAEGIGNLDSGHDDKDEVGRRRRTSLTG